VLVLTYSNHEFVMIDENLKKYLSINKAYLNICINYAVKIRPFQNHQIF